MRVKLLILNLIANLIVIKLPASTKQPSVNQTSKWAFFNTLSSTLAENKSAIKTAGHISTDFSSMPTVPISALPSGDYLNKCKDCVCRNNILDCLCNNQKKSLNYQGLCDSSQTITFLDNNLTPTSGYWFEFCKLNELLNGKLPTNNSDNKIFANIVTANLSSFRNNVLSMTNLYTANNSTSKNVSASENTSASISASNLNQSISKIANNFNTTNLAASLSEKKAGAELILQQKQTIKVIECSNQKLFYNFATGACGTAGAISAPCTSTGSKVYNFSTGSCQEAGIAQNIADCKFINGVYNISTGSCNQAKFKKSCQKTGGYFYSGSGVCDQDGQESSCQNRNGKFNKVTGLCDQSAAMTSCTNIKGIFLPHFGECDQSIAQKTCNNTARGSFNTTTGSCSDLPGSEPCKNAQGVFTYNYNSDNTAITTNCDQSAAIASCSAKRGNFGPLWPKTMGTCELNSTQKTCNTAGGSFNTTTGSCSDLPGSEPCKNAKGVFTYNYNSDNTAINTNCDQSAAIASCSAKRGNFGPLWPNTMGTCDLKSAQKICINTAGGDFNSETGICSDCPLSAPMKWCINQANGDFNNNGLNSTCTAEDGSNIPFTSQNQAERYLGCP